MSGFLDRMGARAADGSRPEVTNRLVTSSAPRVPALFESATVTTEPTGITEPVSPALAAAEVPAAAVPSVAVPSVAVPWVAVPPVDGRPALPAAEVLPVRPDRESAQVRVERELVPMPAERSPLPTPAARQSQPATRQSQPAALVVPAAPVALAPAAPAGAMNESSVAAQRGPDVIRVSIGRVDVRAPAAPPRPSTPVPVPAAKADRLSLQDYLRGQRGTR
jgi:hypothetical protein